MKNITLLFLAITCLFLTSSCDDEELPAANTTEVSLKFLATYDGQPLLFNQDLFATDYQYEGLDIFFQRFSFYISDIVLLEEGSEDEVELSEVEFLDFTENSTTTEAEAPQTLTFNSVPTGDYKGIKFSLGVPADLNDQNPNTDFSSGHPLGMTSHYWSDWNSYIFMKINGIYDKEDDGINVSEDVNFAMHTGGDEAFRVANPIFTSITLEQGVPGEFTFEVDIKKILDQVDFGDAPNLHTGNPDDKTLLNQVMDNFQGAVSLK